MFFDHPSSPKYKRERDLGKEKGGRRRAPSSVYVVVVTTAGASGVVMSVHGRNLPLVYDGRGEKQRRLFLSRRLAKAPLVESLDADHDLVGHLGDFLERHGQSAEKHRDFLKSSERVEEPEEL